jgi:hypothetical protein
MRRPRLTPGRVLVLAVLAAGLISVPLSGAGEGRPAPTSLLLNHVSQSVAVRYWMAHPEKAPERIRESIKRLNSVRSLGQLGPRFVSTIPGLFNEDDFGLPQNEESITPCAADTSNVLGGTNDYRGILDPEQNFTGWHFSTNGKGSIAKEGLLPSINGIPSGGDPVDASFGRLCDFYAASLNYDPFEPDTQPNGIGVYKTDAATLNSAACNPVYPFDAADPDCWPNRTFVAFTPNVDQNQFHFLDKEWMYVGNSPGFSGGRAVWVTYTDFRIPGDNGEDFNASIYAVRCGANLNSCSKPILISGDDKDVQFSDVTIGPDGSTYITWSEIKGELEGTPQTFVHKLRAAPPGSTAFGPTRKIHSETMAIPFGGFLQGNDFRIATYLKNTVAPVGEGLDQRVWAIWDACKQRPLDTICVEPVIKLKWSTDDGATWSNVHLLSNVGVNYFPAIDYDPVAAHLDACWYTNRFDAAFENAQDVECVNVNRATGNVQGRSRITPSSNETEADPLLGGFFIGDYFEVAGYAGTAYVHFNANYRKVPLLGPFGVSTIPVNQQDNFLTLAFD